MTTQGKAWKQRFIGKNCTNSSLFLFQADPYDLFVLDITFYFKEEEVMIKNYKAGGKYKNGKPKSPYKKQDVDNLLKLTADAISDLLGVDDRAFWEIRIRKEIAEDTSGLKATVTKRK